MSGEDETSKAARPDPMVDIAQGRLRGETGADGVLAFRGVPYAEAERFRPPTRAKEDYEDIIGRLLFDDANLKRFRTSVVLNRVKASLAMPLGGG